MNKDPAIENSQRTWKHLVVLIGIKLFYVLAWSFATACGAYFLYELTGSLWLAVPISIVGTIFLIATDDKEEDSRQALLYPVRNYLKR